MDELVSPQTVVVNVTSTACPPHSACNDSSVAGPVVGALLGGIVLGAVVTFILMKYVFKYHRKHHIPPRDYPPATETSNTGDTVVAEVEDSNTYDFARSLEVEKPANTKTHKKLERVSKHSVPVPGHIEIPSAATPLITEECPANSPVNGTNNNEVSETGRKPIYTNEGSRSFLEQPYESLQVIPEEVEYENSKNDTYETFTEVPNIKTVVSP